MDHLSEQIREYDERLEHLALTRYPEIRLMTQVAGVGTLSALTFRLTIGDPWRFAKSRDVGCYLGLQPKRSQSGSRDPQLGITKQGDSRLRRTLVNCAHYILGPFGPDCDLRRWGLEVAARGGNGKKRAVVAVARKLAVLLHRLWVSGGSIRAAAQCSAYNACGSLEQNTTFVDKLAVRKPPNWGDCDLFLGFEPLTEMAAPHSREWNPMGTGLSMVHKSADGSGCERRTGKRRDTKTFLRGKASR